MSFSRSLLRSLSALALLAGCSGSAPAPPAALIGGGDAFSWYRGAIAKEPVYRIDSARSLIAVTVRRGGPFARFGHDHVVASRRLTGYAAPRSGRADFQFRLDEMSVDEAELRQAAQLDTTPDADAIAGTRANMLGKVLEAERYPVVQLRANRSAADPAKLRLAITLHGVTRGYDVPAKIEASARTVSASGELTVLQSDFGITPMSVFGGALTVQDALHVRFSIVAQALR